MRMGNRKGPRKPDKDRVIDPVRPIPREWVRACDKATYDEQRSLYDQAKMTCLHGRGYAVN